MWVLYVTNIIYSIGLVQRLPFTVGFLGSMGATLYASMVLHSYILSVFFSGIQVIIQVSNFLNILS